MKYEKIYQKLKKKYTDEEIADSMLIPADLTESEKGAADEEIKKLRFEMLRNMTTEDQILSDVMRLRFQIENYLKKEPFSFGKTFGQFLGEYIRVTKKSKKEMAEDLSVHYTKLSRLLNDKEEPNIGLAYRLGKHSGNLIAALLWWKLMVKKQEFIISEDDGTRLKEERKVRNALRA
ncbi:MAG TPA: hypothetical protein ENJ95_02285 [Bacteroidetes bacterium]|nr:hypothetical protein [Bacteroidota bacterium]